MILERTALGRERAKARGVKFGRPSKMNSSVAEAVRLLREKGAGIKDIARSLGNWRGKRLPSTSCLSNSRLKGQNAVLKSFLNGLDSLFKNTALTPLQPLSWVVVILHMFSLFFSSPRLIYNHYPFSTLAPPSHPS